MPTKRPLSLSQLAAIAEHGSPKDRAAAKALLQIECGSNGQTSPRRPSSPFQTKARASAPKLTAKQIERSCADIDRMQLAESRAEIRAAQGLSAPEYITPNRVLFTFNSSIYAVDSTEYKYVRARSAYGDVATREAITQISTARLKNHQPALLTVKV